MFESHGGLDAVGREETPFPRKGNFLGWGNKEFLTQRASAGTGEQRVLRGRGDPAGGLRHPARAQGRASGSYVPSSP